jgi:hypothetical protein
MIGADYIHPGSEIAKLDAEINRCCIAHDTAGAMKALTARRALEAAVKVAAVGVAVLALLPAMALAAPAKHAQLRTAAKEFKAAEQRLYQTGSLPAGTVLRVACKGTSKRIVCTGTANATFGSYKYTETFAVSGASLSSANGLVPVA